MFDKVCQVDLFGCGMGKVCFYFFELYDFFDLVIEEGVGIGVVFVFVGEYCYDCCDIDVVENCVF